MQYSQALTRSNLRESKIQKFPGEEHAPRPPRCRVLTHMDLYTVTPPYSHKPLFCPPLSHFLNEGLTLYNLHVYVYAYKSLTKAAWP